MLHYHHNFFRYLSFLLAIVFLGAISAQAQSSRKNKAPWWSLTPLLKVELPEEQSEYPKWNQHPIDRFIIDKMTGKNLEPSPMASPTVLIRRLYYDVIGLPPTPEDIQSFSARCYTETGNKQDIGPVAYAALIDQLLDSPQYGERWARHWLDIVHFGETHGYDKDKRRDNAWPYRDYVIRAFNDDKPYPEFITQQVAGDIITPNDADGIIATGFLASGPWDFVGQKEVREGTMEKKRVRNLDRDDIITNVFTTFSSSTVQCARCHDHKFDPISIKEYYNLQAIFSGIERDNREYVDDEKKVTRSALNREINKIKQQLEQTKKAILEKLPSEYHQASEKITLAEANYTTWEDEQSKSNKKSPTNGYHSTISATQNSKHWVQVTLKTPAPLDSIQLIPAFPTDYKDTPGFGFPLRFTVEISPSEKGDDFTTLTDHSAADYPNPGNIPIEIALSKTPVQRIRITTHKLWERNSDFVFALAELQAYVGKNNVAQKATVTASSSIDYGRWHTKNLVDGYDSRKHLPTNADIPKNILGIKKYIAVTKEKNTALYQQNIPKNLRTKQLKESATLEKLRTQLAELNSPTKVYSIKSLEPRPIHVLNRGSVKSPGEKVGPGALAFIKGYSNTLSLKDDTEGAARVALAEWLCGTDNSLTWRSIANRIWQYHFGRGIVDTPNDFGKAGSNPTHPELLDWLALQFREEPSFKKLHKLILTSKTYQQTSATQADNSAIDASNQYLWRMNRRKLDAESLHDSVLSVSQKLNLRMGGPSYDLFNYTHDHSPKYDYLGKDSPEVWRRSIYRFVVRSVPDPLFDALDCADPNLNTPVRNQTLTAPQALAMLNDTFIIAQSIHTANYLNAQTQDTTKQIQRLHHHALGRPATPQELATLEHFTKTHGLESTTRLIFNLNEFMFVD